MSAECKKCRTYSMQQQQHGHRHLMQSKRQLFMQIPKRAAHLSHMLEQLKELQQLPEVPVETLK